MRTLACPLIGLFFETGFLPRYDEPMTFSIIQFQTQSIKDK